MFTSTVSDTLCFQHQQSQTDKNIVDVTLTSIPGSPGRPGFPAAPGIPAFPFGPYNSPTKLLEFHLPTAQTQD